MPVRLPAHQIVEMRRDRLLVDQRGQADDQGADDQTTKAMKTSSAPARSHRACQLRSPGSWSKSVDQPPDEVEQPGLDQRRSRR